MMRDGWQTMSNASGKPRRLGGPEVEDLHSFESDDWCATESLMSIPGLKAGACNRRVSVNMNIDSPADVADRLVREVEVSDSVIELSEPLQPPIPPGEYDAICLSVNAVDLKSYKRKAWFFRFQIIQMGPAGGVLLDGFANLGPIDDSKMFAKSTGKRRRESKLIRWWRIICAFDPDCSRKYISQRAFKKYLFRVLVSNVETDNRQRPIPKAGQYQKVDEITAVISRLGGVRS
jgi:hypothetical protein